MFTTKFSPGEIQFNDKRYKTNATLLQVIDGKLAPATGISSQATLVIRLHPNRYQVEDPIHSKLLYEGTEDYVHQPRIFICCYKSIYCYFEDYVQSFREPLGAQILLFDSPSDLQISPHHLYIFLQYPNPRMSFLLNTEQLTRPEYFRQTIDLLSSGTSLIDYSPENLYLLREIPGEKFLLEYQYRSEEIQKLVEMTDPQVDVVFVGTLSPKRQLILDQLASKVTVAQVNGWGEERDSNLMKGKILLNIHYSDSYSIYESIRCDRLIFAGMIVVTERSTHQDQIGINDLLFIEEYSGLVQRVLEILADYPRVKSEFLEKHRRLLPEIVKRREDQVSTLNTRLQI